MGAAGHNLKYNSLLPIKGGDSFAVSSANNRHAQPARD